ncbi:aspartate--tRNA ligase 2, cytoplasmic-like [Papaver somniferum]|uniref:aspartate--tRNA ligase 2, cytoplasmic-like n=1 Tax=Papaver somniferum TaxID=3469 RepID=UPI000E700F59|nr:aspartate--tRNA ligase 2, cytoplasmic-like [Papaver somniferum]
MQVVEFVESLFVDMFNKLHEKCKEDFQAIQNQHPYEKLKYFQFNAKVRFDVGLQLLENAGTKVIHPLRGLNPEEERKLGKIVLEEYETEFYILYDCPSAGSTFYTKQSPDVRHSSNSFDVFLRGKKILSGGEREIDPDALYSRAADLKISGTDLGDWDSVCTYIEAFQCTMPRHGGFGVDLNQVTTMLFSTNDTDKAGVDGKEAAVKGIEAAGKDGKDTSRKARNKARVKDKGK